MALLLFVLPAAYNDLCDVTTASFCGSVTPAGGAGGFLPFELGSLLVLGLALVILGRNLRGSRRSMLDGRSVDAERLGRSPKTETQ